MKIFKHRNLMGLIYSFVIAIPVLSILATSCYAVFNKNAKDSYYGETINQSIITDYSQLNVPLNEQLYFTNPLLSDINTENFTASSNYYQVKLLETNITALDNYVNQTIYFSYYRGLDAVGDSYSYRLFFANALPIANNQIAQADTNFAVNLKVEVLFFTNTNTTNINAFSKITYNKYSYLDNAFDYSIDKLVSENSWGKLNLFEWFTDLFLDMNADNNALYIHFVNWYMNYVLFVSSAYILFLVLMWFINYSRKILERGMNYDW